MMTFSGVSGQLRGLIMDCTELLEQAPSLIPQKIKSKKVRG